MAVAPPYDQLTKLPALATDKLNVALAKLINFLKKIADKIKEKVGALSGNIKCSDPRIIEIKQLLEKFKQTVDRIRNVLVIITTVVVILNVAINIASASLQGSLVIPLPATPILAQAVSVLNVLIANIIAAVKQLSVFLPIVTGAIAGVSAGLGSAINKLGSICTKDTFDVNTVVAENMLKDIDSKIKSNLDFTSTSKFYQTLNVSQEDIDNRSELIEELLERNKSIITNLLEAPSKVILGDSMPTSEQGKLGDYFIIETTRTIYGPKLSDSEWGTAINY
jgi:hypothetical protein